MPWDVAATCLGHVCGVPGRWVQRAWEILAPRIIDQKRLRTCNDVLVYACIGVWVPTRLCMYVRLHVCVCVSLCVHMSVCVYACMRVRAHNVLVVLNFYRFNAGEVCY